MKGDQATVVAEHCYHCNGTGWVAIRSRDGTYSHAGPVPDDAKGYAEACCWECSIWPGKGYDHEQRSGFDGPTGAD